MKKIVLIILLLSIHLTSTKAQVLVSDDSIQNVHYSRLDSALYDIQIVKKYIGSVRIQLYDNTEVNFKNWPFPSSAKNRVTSISIRVSDTLNHQINIYVYYGGFYFKETLNKFELKGSNDMNPNKQLLNFIICHDGFIPIGDLEVDYLLNFNMPYKQLNIRNCAFRLLDQNFRFKHISAIFINGKDLSIDTTYSQYSVSITNNCFSGFDSTVSVCNDYPIRNIEVRYNYFENYTYAAFGAFGKMNNLQISNNTFIQIANQKLYMNWNHPCASIAISCNSNSIVNIDKNFFMPTIKPWDFNEYKFRNIEILGSIGCEINFNITITNNYFSFIKTNENSKINYKSIYFVQFTSNIKIINNTFNSINNSTDYGETYAYIYVNKGSNINFMNNLFQRTGIKSGLYYGVQIYITKNDSGKSLISNSSYNIFSPQTDNYIYWFDNKVYTIKTIYPQELYSYEDDIQFRDSISPVLASAYEGHFTLMGKPLPEITEDIYGNPRDPLHPYRGAYEGKKFSNVSIKENEEKQILIYPNPTESVLHLGEEIKEGELISIYGMDGKLLISEALNESKTIPLEKLPKGLYFLHTANGNGVKVMKE